MDRGGVHRRVRTIDRVNRQMLEDHGLPVGTTAENRVTWLLHRWDVLDKFQYRVAPYRLDYAWPAVKIGLEVDGPHHWRPDVAVKDRFRDGYLRARDWLVFRVDDSDDTLALEKQLSRVVRVIRSET